MLRLSISLIVVCGFASGFVDAQQREGQRDPQREGQRREGQRDPQREGDQRREGQRDQKREGQRRSAERDAGPRRSAERDTPRRSAEGDRGARRAAEGDNPLRGFQPRTEREAALYRMIQQLQREVADLRRTVRSSSNRDGVASARDGVRRDGDPPRLPDGWQRSKVGGIFRAYDKNRDGYVGLDEWLAMTNGNASEARRELQTRRFRETRPGDDQKLSAAEFIYWWNRREGASRDRDVPRDGDRGAGTPLGTSDADVLAHPGCSWGEDSLPR